MPRVLVVTIVLQVRQAYLGILLVEGCSANEFWSFPSSWACEESLFRLALHCFVAVARCLESGEPSEWDIFLFLDPYQRKDFQAGTTWS